MPKEKKPKPVFEERGVTILREEVTKNRKTVLRVVQWVVDGKETPKRLEKRAYFVKDEKVMNGKMSGLTKNDMDWIIANWPDIEHLFD